MVVVVVVVEINLSESKLNNKHVAVTVQVDQITYSSNYVSLVRFFSGSNCSKGCLSVAPL